MTQATDAALVELVTVTNGRGAELRCGDYLSDWDEGVHPYGQAKRCPFCREAQDFTSLWYNGPGSPPSYAWQCGSCGAQGPTSSGFSKGDHYNAIINAREQWDQAADTIEAQARRIEALEGALRPFAKAGTLAGERDPRWDFYVYRPGAGDEYAIMGDHLRCATAALEPTP